MTADPVVLAYLLRQALALVEPAEPGPVVGGRDTAMIHVATGSPCPSQTVTRESGGYICGQHRRPVAVTRPPLVDDDRTAQLTVAVRDGLRAVADVLGVPWQGIDTIRVVADVVAAARKAVEQRPPEAVALPDGDEWSTLIRRLLWAMVSRYHGRTVVTDAELQAVPARPALSVWGCAGGMGVAVPRVQGGPGVGDATAVGYPPPAGGGGGS